SYNQFSAFQIAISLCLAGSGLGFFTGLLSRDSTCSDSLRRIAVIQPAHELRIFDLSAQAAVNLDACRFKKTHKTVETGPHVGGLQGLESVGEEIFGGSVHCRIGPRRQAGRLATFAEVGA